MQRQLIPLLLLTLLLVACSPAGAPVTPTNPPAAVTELPGASEVQATATQLPNLTSIPEVPTVEPTYDPAVPGSWEYLPVIPDTISQKVREIYVLGQKSGLNPRAFSKVGDCETFTSYFLSPFDWKDSGYRLGEYQSLKPVIDYFQGSFARESLAAKQGFSVASVLSPLWADPETCNSGESPLACEYRIQKPAFALIMFGTNDVASSREVFESNLRALVEITLDYNIIPILATKADNLEGDGSINAIIAKIAYDYDVPLWNYWRALQHLPDHGLQDDQTHLTYAQPFFDYPENMLKGWPWRNLTALQMLEKMHQELN
jgi:hypothetical protein